MLGGKRQPALRFRLDNGNLLVFMVQHFFHQMRAEYHAVIGQNRSGMRHLQRRVGVIALPDTDGHHFGNIPAPLVFRQMGKTLGLPFRCRQNAAILARQINARALAQTECRQIRCGFLNAQLKAQPIKKRIGRYLNRLAQICRTVAAAHRIAENMLRSWNTPSPRGRHHRLLINFAAFQQSHRHKRLKCRARRIQALRHTVNQWPLPVFVQCLPAFAVNAVNKDIRVEIRFRNKG